MSDPTNLIVFGLVLALRLFVPLFIPRFPLPAVIACLVIDGVDQTIFQRYTDLDLTNYQSYDKALDIYYLAIAYLATFRNWDNLVAFEVSRFLYYFRLVGVVLFEATHLRAMLLFFPNTFEYFFIFYEAVRLRWNPARMGATLVVVAASVIWFGIKVPQEYWIHVAQMDVTDELAARPVLIPILGVAILALLVGAWWVVTKRCPPADHRFSLEVPDPFGEATYRRLHNRIRTRKVFDLALLEKVILISLISVIFAQILPGLDASAVQVSLSVGLLIVLNTVVSEWLGRRGVSWSSAFREFFAMMVINTGLVMAYSLLISASSTILPRGNALFFLFLISLLITMYDRYQPYYMIRSALRDGTLTAEDLRADLS